MTQTYFPFDSGNGASVTEAQWFQMARKWRSTGVLEGELDELETYGDSSGMQIKIKSGQAWLEGHFFQSDAEETLAIVVADASNPRIDRVVVQLDRVNNIVQLVVLTGVAASSPSAPSLTQNSSVWETSLAQIRVNAGATSIASGDVRDERDWSRAGGTPYLAKMKTIRLDPGMSTLEMQSIIDGVNHEILPGKSLYFQFDDGNHTLTESLSFRSFYGGGRLYVQGNPSESGLHTTQAVVLDGSSLSDHPVVFFRTFVDVVVINLKIKVNVSANKTVYVSKCSNISLDGLFLQGNDNNYRGLYVFASVASVRNSYFDNMYYAIVASTMSLLLSSGNDDVGTQPSYGLYAYASAIFKSGTQITGSVSDELVGAGGQIW